MGKEKRQAKPDCILLSIKPIYYQRIAQRLKGYEFRKQIPPHVKKVLMYVSAPVQKICGEFRVQEVLHRPLEVLWQLTHESAGISRIEFDTYFSTKTTGYALKIADLQIYAQPVSPASLFENFTPPQNYRYVLKL